MFSTGCIKGTGEWRWFSDYGCICYTLQEFLFYAQYVHSFVEITANRTRGCSGQGETVI